MYAISQDFRDALVKSHQIATRVEILSANQVAAVLDVVVAGTVTVERQASTRRRCQITLVDVDGTLTPDSATDLLTPYGNEIRLHRGVTFADGTTEVVPLITARIARVEVSDTNAGVVISLTGYDRSRSVSRAKFTEPYQVAEATNYATAIEDLIADRVPNTEFQFGATNYTTPALVFLEGDDPWAKAVEMANACGMDVYFDSLGVCRLRPEPDPSEASHTDWSYSEGSEATMLGMLKVHDDERMYNGVIVTGESTSLDAPVRGEAWDDNPASPTYRSGQYGSVPEFVRSAYVTTEAQATEAAEAQLRSRLGLSERVSFPALVNPAHDVGDLITVTRDDILVAATYVLDSVTLPLEAEGTMQAICRERRTLS